MDTTATVSNVSDGLGEQSPVEESDQITDEQRSEVQRWSYCCRLRFCHVRSVEFHRKNAGYCGLANVVGNSDIMNSSCGCNWGIVLKTGVGFSHIFTFRMFTKFCQPFEEVM